MAKTKTAKSDAALRDWIKAEAGTQTCSTCGHADAAALIRKLLTLMIEEQRRPSNAAFFQLVKAEHPDYAAKNHRRMFDHIRNHEAELYAALLKQTGKA